MSNDKKDMKEKVKKFHGLISTEKGQNEIRKALKDANERLKKISDKKSVRPNSIDEPITL